MNNPILNPQLPTQSTHQIYWSQLIGASTSLVISNAAKNAQHLLVAITPDMNTANQLSHELHFFNGDHSLPILIFPDWETLPYDHFSPHQDIISERLSVLYQLPTLKKGILIVTINTLMQRLLPKQHLESHSFVLKRNQTFAIDTFRQRLEQAGYRAVSQVMEHGEFSVRGSLIDLFPMGSRLPYRIDLFDNEVDSIRTFNPDTQRTIETIEHVELLPAREFPLTETAISQFRQAWRARFHGNPTQSSLYQSISQGESAAGIEYYLPLFFEQTETLFNYLATDSVILKIGDLYPLANQFWCEINERYEQLKHDVSRPLLPPQEIFLPVDQLFGLINEFPQIQVEEETRAQTTHHILFDTEKLPDLTIDGQKKEPLEKISNWLLAQNYRVLLCAETAGRREALLELLQTIQLKPNSFDSWNAFLESNAPVGITIAPLERGFILNQPHLALITETQLFNQQVMQRRLRKQREIDSDAIIRDLSELKIGSPVVHIDHGVGRYLGLQVIKAGAQETEYLTLEYADKTKLYVPVSSLHLISRYSGAQVENAPLHRLGTNQWDKAKRKAAEKIRDVAAELLDIYAQRAAKPGFAFKQPDANYLAFAAAFPFEETPDQAQAIRRVIDDMSSPRTMDRVVCGDVGFGKTEVAIRAAFIAVNSNKQVAVLVPTTLLAEQHLQNFRDRFANWPIRIEAISRFRTKKDQDKIISEMKDGKIDIVIGTHKLLQKDIQFKNLGLLIVDEEHRFGVQQKERIKALRANIDILTLTATPIPRTLNMALASIRDLSIIATPPARRLSVKTFVHEHSNSLIREAVLREILRGGQVYFLHNEVQTITKIAHELNELLPEARINIAHGQMHERELEKIMSDFYHQRFNLLVSTTIIESGIDIPTANTIIIHRADRFGLAQLHQLRGRVGRSHHQAYAYLLTPPVKAMTADAKKRLEAIGSLESLGSGFTLATYDLEIRGAGELLGEEQSGHIQEIGFSLYMELLEQTVAALKRGKTIDLDKPLYQGTEVKIQAPALIPESYINDVHTRLILYKRMANSKKLSELKDLQIEMIDRFGLLPPATHNLFEVTSLKLFAIPLGITKIEISEQYATIEFSNEPNIDVKKLIELVQKQPKIYQLSGKEKLRVLLTVETLAEKVRVLEKLFHILIKEKQAEVTTSN